ncbi:MAG: WhiB family transcriptional regulator [Rhodococcus sp. (in: high G+C Gram-positive bacteria)]|uniref:WhiB family transcriptional regulator n=1 Tax=Rhodococcus sp. TaxID=1831 RepID=UPI003BB6F649
MSRTRSKLPRIPDTIAGLVDPRLSGARCAGKAPLFDTEIEEEFTEDRSARLAWAAQQCTRCPVQSACRTAVTELGHPTGMWAGRVHGRLGRPEEAA